MARKSPDTPPCLPDGDGRLRSRLDPYLTKDEIKRFRSLGKKRYYRPGPREGRGLHYRPSAVLAALNPALDKILAGPLNKGRMNWWRFVAEIPPELQHQAAMAYRDNPRRAAVAWSLPEWQRILFHDRVGAGQGSMGFALTNPTMKPGDSCAHEYHERLRALRQLIGVLTRCENGDQHRSMNSLAGILERFSGPAFGMQIPIAAMLYRAVAQEIRQTGRIPELQSLDFCYRGK